MEEVWKDISGFEGRYQVSNLGAVRSLMHRFGTRDIPKLLSVRIEGKGYHQARLYLGEGKSVYRKVHRLVAEAFIENLGGLPEVNHLDENKLNNRVDNLEWSTSKNNNHHSLKHVWSILNIRTGEVTKSVSLRDFALKNGLQSTNLHKTFRGTRNQTGGWKVIGKEVKDV